MSNATPPGWQPGKFVIQHYRRGDLLDGEAFALVPERDPAAIVALTAYARATPDPALATALHEWVRRIRDERGEAVTPASPDDPIPSWVASLEDEIAAGLPVRRALFRMASLASGNTQGETP